MADSVPSVSETIVRVNYSETDQMGVVYHARYLVWLDVARCEHLRLSASGARAALARELPLSLYSESETLPLESDPLDPLPLEPDPLESLPLDPLPLEPDPLLPEPESDWYWYSPLPLEPLPLEPEPLES